MADDGWMHDDRIKLRRFCEWKKNVNSEIDDTNSIPRLYVNFEAERRPPNVCKYTHRLNLIIYLGAII